MKRAWMKISEILKDDGAQGMAEYGLILFLIVVACVAIVSTLGGDFKEKLSEASKTIGSATHK